MAGTRSGKNVDYGDGTYADAVVLYDANNQPLLTQQALNGTIAKTTTAPLVGAAVMGNDGTNLVLVDASTAGSDGQSNTVNALRVSARQNIWNGTTWDRFHGTMELTVLASASRTVQTASADFTNYSARGIKLYLNVSAITGGPGTGIILRLQGKDPVSGSYSSLAAAPTAVAATGLLVYSFYPSVFTAGFAAHNNQALERTWRVLMTVSDATPYTYSVGACLLV